MSADLILYSCLTPSAVAPTMNDMFVMIYKSGYDKYTCAVYISTCIHLNIVELIIPVQVCPTHCGKIINRSLTQPNC